MAVDFGTQGGRLTEVICVTGQRFECRAAVLCPGTFLNGLIHTGEFSVPAGRIGEAPATQLSGNLIRKDFTLGRLKTGTPPRLDGRTIDYTRCEPQPGDGRIIPFQSEHRYNIINSLVVILRIPRPRLTKSLETVLRARPCSPERSLAEARATARPSKTRSYVSRTRIITRSSSSPRAGKLPKST